MGKSKIYAGHLARSRGCWTVQHGWFLARRKHILMIAERVLGGRSEAERWLLKPARGLDFQTPCSLLFTQWGFQNVESLLFRIEHCVYT
jgi:putative toxin-antitoxin system antitoxin component (TIGR02293 family)